ncbi:SMC-Scp complex subunit ScpB [candidate division GN15 bacterium]|uniref:SMC-Scp complex subunit ScpB n=1 Tax=candidate division GN15 bacterium TaxID=2072418 RepID=A0A855X2I3_9BACT|nr:MAG: SMC-Scp complex subunit ScpB [candidate division GN15 bacterium]
MDLNQLPSIIEALILSSPEPLPARRILQVLADVTPVQVTRAVEALNVRYEQSGTSFRIREIAGGFQYYILPDYAGYVDELFTRRRKMRLTRAALESVAIVAYRQPVTKAEIEHIRGVASDAVLQNLLEKNMVTIVGRARTVGKPLQYGTTDEFLKFFGLANLEALPKMEEIEAMLAASQSRGQTELELKDELAETALNLKLNVADGSFDPSSREDMDYSGPDSVPAAGTTESDQALHIWTNPQHEAFRPDADNNMDPSVPTGDWDKGPGKE